MTKPKKRVELSYLDQLRRIARAGLEGSPQVGHRTGPNLDELPTVEARVDSILGIVNKLNRKPTNMLFFVMYDISSNKVRNLVVKYLIKQGCTRIQKSIFLADLDSKTYEQIKTDLTEVQAAYENKDSILVVPLSTDYLKAMKVIGQNIDVDIITHAKSTLFF